jgi:electron transfer flavoprotein beta subunit
MDIIVCIKQVPESIEVQIDPKTNTLIREGVDSIVNPFDMHALEEGLRIKEELGGTVTAISMGPPQAKEVLKEAISMGADNAILLSDRKFAGADTLATALTLGTAIKKISNVDLIICGKQAIDGDTAQVGPGIAEVLDIPHVSYVGKVEDINSGQMQVERITESGYEVIETFLPALITVLKDINEPRLPTFKGKMRAKNMEIPVWGPEDLELEENHIGLSGSPTQVIKIFKPQRVKKGEICDGQPEECADRLVSFLKEKEIV